MTAAKLPARRSNTEIAEVVEVTTTTQYVTVTIAGQMFGIPVLKVRDVLNPQRITKIPLASAEVAGSLNLRGRIVTAIDLRVRMGLPEGKGAKSMSAVVEHKGER